MNPEMNPELKPELNAEQAQDIDLHVFRYAEIGAELTDSLLDCLSSGEHQKHSELSPQRGRQYLLERGLLRKVLASKLNTSARSLEFSRTSAGKPYLALSDSKDPQVLFNLSHCDELFVCAISTCGDIGVDIESSRRSNQFEKIAAHYFSEQEKIFLEEQADHFDQRFTQLWTLKEAIGKMRGTGVNKTFLKNATEIRQGRIEPNNAWLGEPVVSGSFKSDNHFLSFAVVGDSTPACKVHSAGWSAL